MPYHVYVLTNRPRGTLYTGVTNGLARRLQQHLTGEGSKFAQRYRLSRLVFVDSFDNVQEAIAAEKRFKRWKRRWKIAAIEKLNPKWLDLRDPG
jgi:putative endonuclease